jgi:hypothetical protein
VGARVQTAVIVFSACGIAASGLFGCVGSPVYPERFDAKTVVITPAATHSDGLRITEYVDIDFGTAQRRGYERYIPTDFGEPIDITASSPSAPDDLGLERVGDELRIRIGDPDIVNTGRHRYELAYTLPETGLASGVFALDIIGTQETLRTERFTVVISGIDLTDTVCSVGGLSEVGGCELLRTARGLETEIAPLEPGQGITIQGRVNAITDPITVDPGPPLPERVPDDTVVVTALMLIGGLGGGWAMRRRSIRHGSNLIGGDGSAAGAAFSDGSGPTRSVTDRELAAMATIEFVPPRDIAPWEGTVILEEALTENATEAWFTTLQGRGIIDLAEVTEPSKGLRIAPGPQISSLNPAQAALLADVFANGSPRLLASYDPQFSETWQKIAAWQASHIDARQWWQRRIGSNSARSILGIAVILAVVAVIATAVAGVAIRSTGTGIGTLTGTAWFGVVWSATVVAGVAFVAGSATRRSRTASGSAAYLKTESFRRFLAASEARHVEEAWKRGVIREYTAWAVALGEADAWRRAAQSVAEPAVMAAVTGTAFGTHRYFSSAHTPPSSSASGSSGSGVGSGGGGGRSGSW